MLKGELEMGRDERMNELHHAVEAARNDELVKQKLKINEYNKKWCEKDICGKHI